MEGLRDVVVGTAFQPFDLHFALGLGGHEHDRNRLGLDVLLDRLAKFDARHFGHHHVAEHQIGRGLAQRFERLATIAHNANAKLAPHDHRQKRPHIGVVFRDQYLGSIRGRMLDTRAGACDTSTVLPALHRALHFDERVCSPAGAPQVQIGFHRLDGATESQRSTGIVAQHLLIAIVVRLPDRQEQAHRCSSPLPFALGPDPPSMQLHHLLRERESDAGALIAAGRRGIDLGETIEDRTQLVGRNADAGVRNSECDRVTLTLRRKLDAIAALCEFQRVPHEIHKHLLDRLRVGIDFRQIRKAHCGNLDAFAIGECLRARHQLLYKRRKPHRAPMDGELFAFHLREIKQIVDHLGKAPAVGVHGRQHPLDSLREAPELA